MRSWIKCFGNVPEAQDRGGELLGQKTMGTSRSEPYWGALVWGFVRI